MIRPTTRGLFLPCGLAAVVWLFASGAHAAASAAIDVTGLQVSVEAIRPGSTPGVSFTSAGGSTAQSMATAGMPAATWLVTNSGGGAFGQASSASWAGVLAGSSAMLAGDVFGAGGLVHASAFAASTGPVATAQGIFGLGNGVGAASFTLAPGTRMTITASVCATASTTGASPFEYADSGLSLALSDADGVGSQFVRFTFDAIAFGSLGPFDDVETTTLSLVYENDGDVAMTGLFSGYVGSIATSGMPVSAVPEPGGAAMLAIGLAALAWRRPKRAGQ